MEQCQVAIVTFHNAQNYGAVLQAYALKEAIQSIGFRACMYPHQDPEFDRIYTPRILPFFPPKAFLSRFIRYPQSLRKHCLFKCFLRERLLNTSYVLGEETIYITGSDQVWNYEWTKFDKTYFLDFVRDSGRKCSYAASFGFDSIPENFKATYKALLSDFSHITVREEQGAAIIRELVGRDASVVLDPTLLLTKEDWEARFPQNCPFENFILVYVFEGIRPELARWVNTLQAQSGCEVIVIGNRSYTQARILNNARYLSDIGPDMWVLLLLHCRYVFTNSFHCTAFALNFGKDFFVQLLPLPAKINSRLTNILSMFDMQERIIGNNLPDLLASTINVTQIQTRLHQERERSLAILEKILSV